MGERRAFYLMEMLPGVVIRGRRQRCASRMNRRGAAAVELVMCSATPRCRPGRGSVSVTRKAGGLFARQSSVGNQWGTASRMMSRPSTRCSRGSNDQFHTHRADDRPRRTTRSTTHGGRRQPARLMAVLDWRCRPRGDAHRSRPPPHVLVPGRELMWQNRRHSPHRLNPAPRRGVPRRRYAQRVRSGSTARRYPPSPRSSGGDLPGSLNGDDARPAGTARTEALVEALAGPALEHSRCGRPAL